MSSIVQINFPYTESRAEIENHSEEAAGRFTGVDGLVWKIWLVDEATKTAGGIYLFSTREQAEDYAVGELVNHLKNVRDNVTVSVFDTIDGAGLVTNAPVELLH
ncbi:MAG: YdhR family protein [Gammaproteobacteria bacterium]|jgi:hypothetical protein|nr:YdhR family protein [Gammaproteobacteria bacterium]